MVFGTTLVLRAQISKLNIDSPKKKISVLSNPDSANAVSSTHKFITDTAILNALKSKLLEKNHLQNDSNIVVFRYDKGIVELKMPVATGERFSMNMPVMIPDSTVQYFIKEKRIDFVNPKETNSK